MHMQGRGIGANTKAFMDELMPIPREDLDRIPKDAEFEIPPFRHGHNEAAQKRLRAAFVSICDIAIYHGDIYNRHVVHP